MYRPQSAARFAKPKYDLTQDEQRDLQCQPLAVIENKLADPRKATDLGKTRSMVALARALLDHALAKRILFAVDRRTLAWQAISKGFRLLSPNYNRHWITSGNFRAHKEREHPCGGH